MSEIDRIIGMILWLKANNYSSGGLNPSDSLYKQVSLQLI